jgi:hypothetical protein
LFESDLMPAGLPQVQLVIWSIGLLAMPGLVVPMIFTPRYAKLVFAPGTLHEAIATDRVTMITLCMAAMGFSALVIWDGLFPDRRDARILSPLPIGTGTIVTARLGALGAMFVLFVGGTAIVPAVMFAVISGSYVPVPGVFRGIAAQLGAMVLACTFAFFSLIALQATLLAALGRTVVQRLTVGLQIVFTVALLQMVLFLPRLGTQMHDGSTAPDWLSSPSAWFLPSVWFFGVYEVLSGFGGRGAYSLAAVGLAAAAGAVTMTIVLYAAAYARLTRHALETPAVARRRWIRGPVTGAATKVLARLPAWVRSSPVERAVFSFTLRTLARSRQHRMLLAIYFAIALALVMGPIATVVLRGGAVLRRPGLVLASVPLVMLFFMLTGMRSVFAIPVEPKANWAVRVREPADRAGAMAGVRRAMVAAGVAPMVLLVVAALTPLWGISAALRHGVFCLMLGMLLVEILLIGFAKIPFTCTYHPAHSRLRTRWPAYLVAFLAYAYLMPAVEYRVLRTTPRLMVLCAVIGIVIVAIARLRARALSSLPGLDFVDEDPEAVFQGFQLSEGIAASKG